MSKSRAETAYRIQKTKSKSRNIDFNLSFEQWYDWWLAQGVDKNQGSSGHSGLALCMCRKNDSGAYELGNIYCATRAKNSRDARRIDPRSGKAAGFGKQVKTPDGLFLNLVQAGRYYGITREAIGWRIAHWPGWDYVGIDTNKKSIKVPAGIFESQRAAARAMGVPVSTIARRRKSNPKEYYYV